MKKYKFECEVGFGKPNRVIEIEADGYFEAIEKFATCFTPDSFHPTECIKKFECDSPLAGSLK